MILKSGERVKNHSTLVDSHLATVNGRCTCLVARLKKEKTSGDRLPPPLSDTRMKRAEFVCTQTQREKVMLIGPSPMLYFSLLFKVEGIIKLKLACHQSRKELYIIQLL